MILLCISAIWICSVVLPGEYYIEYFLYFQLCYLALELLALFLVLRLYHGTMTQTEVEAIRQIYQEKKTHSHREMSASSTSKSRSRSRTPSTQRSGTSHPNSRKSFINNPFSNNSKTRSQIPSKNKAALLSAIPAPEPTSPSISHQRNGSLSTGGSEIELRKSDVAMYYNTPSNPTSPDTSRVSGSSVVNNNNRMPLVNRDNSLSAEFRRSEMPSFFQSNLQSPGTSSAKPLVSRDNSLSAEFRRSEMASFYSGQSSGNVYNALSKGSSSSSSVLTSPTSANLPMSPTSEGISRAIHQGHSNNSSFDSQNQDNMHNTTQSVQISLNPPTHGRSLSIESASSSSPLMQLPIQSPNHQQGTLLNRLQQGSNNGPAQFNLNGTDQRGLSPIKSPRRDPNQ